MFIYPLTRLTIMTNLRKRNMVRSYSKPQNNAIAGCRHVELKTEMVGDRRERRRDAEKLTMMMMLIVKITMQH